MKKILSIVIVSIIPILSMPCTYTETGINYCEKRCVEKFSKQSEIPTHQKTNFELALNFLGSKEFLQIITVIGGICIKYKLEKMQGDHQSMNTQLQTLEEKTKTQKKIINTLQTNFNKQIENIRNTLQERNLLTDSIAQNLLASSQ